MCWVDFDPILPNFQFIFFDRQLSCIQDLHLIQIAKISNSCFLGDNDPIFKNSKFFFRTDLQDCSAIVSSNIFQVFDFKILRFPKIRFFEYVLFFQIVRGNSVFPKIGNNWFWESWSCPLGPRIMKMMTFLISPKWNRKVISPKWSRMILWRFWANLFCTVTIIMAPQTTQTPNPDFSLLDFYRSKAWRRCRSPGAPVAPAPDVMWRPLGTLWHVWVCWQGGMFVVVWAHKKTHKNA